MLLTIAYNWSQGPPKNSFENIIFQNSMNSHRHSRKWVQVVDSLTAEFKNVTFTSLYVYNEHHVNVDFVLIYIQKPPSESKSNKVEKNLHKKI